MEIRHRALWSYSSRRSHKTYLAQMNLGMALDTTSVATSVIATPQNKPHLAKVSLQIPLETTLENWYRATQKTQYFAHVSFRCQWTGRWKTDAEHRSAATGQHIQRRWPEGSQWTRRGKPTPSVATPFEAPPLQDAIFGTNEPRHAIRHDVRKPTPSAATPKATIFSAGEPRRATGHTSKPTPSTATLGNFKM
jgi:hypothetical protein